jgi:hypothetical protein
MGGRGGVLIVFTSLLKLFVKSGIFEENFDFWPIMAN